MRVHICAVGRLRPGPERTLFEDYQQRFDRTGRNMGLGPLSLHEVEDKKGGGMSAEADLLTRACPAGASLVTLDERGKQVTSPKFADFLGTRRDQGLSDLCFIIGGADGLDTGLKARAEYSFSFGSMVWPHMLVRVMLSEQLYRAATILAGSPYHRV